METCPLRAQSARRFAWLEIGLNDDPHWPSLSRSDFARPGPSKAVRRWVPSERFWIYRVFMLRVAV